MIAGQAHGLHDRLGARHVERHLVETGDPAQARDVVGDHGMIGTEHRTQFVHARRAALDALLVEVVPEQVDAVGAAKIIERIAVEVGELHTGGRLHERTALQVLAHQAAELERDAVPVGELQVGDLVLDLASQRRRRRVALGVQRRQAHEPCTPLLGDIGRRVVGAEELRLVVLVVGNEGCHAARQARVPGQRRMLRSREFQAQLQPVRESRDAEGGGDVRNGAGFQGNPPSPPYGTWMTSR